MSISLTATIVFLSPTFPGILFCIWRIYHMSWWYLLAITWCAPLSWIIFVGIYLMFGQFRYGLHWQPNFSILLQ